MARFVALVVLVVYPLVEAVTAIWVAGRVGWGVVLLAFLLQFVLGAMVMRHAGANAARGLSEAGRRGSLPGGEVGDAALLFLAGLLLAVPGFVTDLAAVVLLFPPTRRWLRRVTGRSVGRRIRAGGFSVTTATVDGVSVTRLHEGDVVAGRVVDRRDADPRDPSPRTDGSPDTRSARDDDGSPPRALPPG